MNIKIHTDGGARGNPGPAAAGVVIEISKDPSHMTDEESKKTIIEFGKRIGETTNNVAEYTAVVEALQAIKSLPVGGAGLRSQAERFDRTSLKVDFYLDSLLVVNQLNGLFKIKDAALRNLALQVRSLEQEIGGVITYTAVSREQNKKADFFVNKALDGK